MYKVSVAWTLPSADVKCHRVCFEQLSFNEYRFALQKNRRYINIKPVKMLYPTDFSWTGLLCRHFLSYPVDYYVHRKWNYSSIYNGTIGVHKPTPLRGNLGQKSEALLLNFLRAWLRKISICLSTVCSTNTYTRLKTDRHNICWNLHF